MDNWSQLLQRVQSYCNHCVSSNSCNNICDVCNFTAYCSDDCRTKDGYGHPLICHHDLSTRIFKYIDLIKNRTHMYCITRTSRLVQNGHYSNINALGLDVTCAICYCNITKIITSGVTTSTRMVLFGNVEYDVCESCSEKKLVLCKHTALDSRKCGNERALWSKRIMLFKIMHDDLISDIMCSIYTIIVQFLKCTQQH